MISMEKDTMPHRENPEIFTNPRKESREQNNELEARMCNG
jgi:hypothetical protein